MEKDNAIDDLSREINALKVTEQSSVAESAKPSVDSSAVESDSSSNSKASSEAKCVKPSVDSSTVESRSSSNRKGMTDEQEDLMHRLVYYQNYFEHPGDADVERMMMYEPSEGDDPSDAEFKYIMEMTTLGVQLIVEFAKNLNGFNKLLREDQINLLKSTTSELLMIKWARRYHGKSGGILLSKTRKQSFTKDTFNLAGLGDTIDDLFDFCKYMLNLRINNAEYGLLTAIALFSDQPGLIEAWKIEKIQKIYKDTLKNYVKELYPDKDDRYEELLSALTYLRKLNESRVLFKHKTKKLPPFLAEIWTFKD